MLLSAVALAACGGTRGSAALTARASDQWTRSYPLDPGGEVQITSRTGPIDIEASDGGTVEVHAERTVFAATEAAAAEVLPRVTIREEASPTRVSVATQPLGGLVIGVRVEVAYRVRAPRGALLRVRSADGAVRVTGFDGRVIASSTNGAVTAEDLAGGLEARAVNGDVNASLREVGRNAVAVRTTNGSIDLAIPADANATLEASAVNGEIDVSGVAFEPTEDTPRRKRGRINGGGIPVELAAVNGRIRLFARQAAALAGTR